MALFNKFETFILLGIFAINLFFLFYIIQPELTSKVIKEVNGDNSIKSPSDFVKEDKIIADSEKIVLNLSNSDLSRYDTSDSMLPVLNSNSTGIGIKPESEEDIHVGDIVSFRINQTLVTHRVVEKNYDSQGIYFITKGDNNILNDEKIRFQDIDSVLIAIIY